RPRRPRAAARGRHSGPPPVVVRRRQADPKSLADASRRAGEDYRGRGDVARSVEARLSLRRTDDLLRVHAGDGNCGRPHGGLLPPPSARPRTLMLTAPLWYFAYGSNLCRATFIERRRMSPLEIRRARLDGYRLTFDLPVGPGERGVANLVADPSA